ncbi:polysaccharide biosynthesis protein CpsF [Streptococcus infantarius subsp. infantarius]|nr:polysaccharide biosynthesis protein CpsF [Streptococcus infantarius subsp. infantarius]
MKICFTSSSGGHFEQLLMLKDLFPEFESFVVTEQTKYNKDFALLPTYFTKQVNRQNILFIFPFFYNIFLSIYILLKEKPKIIVSTGVLSTIPLCLFAKLLRVKIIYIESFAKINSATLTGKLMYKIADVFYVQWPEMLKVYPDAKYVGGIY